MPPRAVITGWGHHAPERVMSNRELETLVDTSCEWISSRTGILERRIAGPSETTSSMCASAGARALQAAGVSPESVDLVICATTTPDYLLPATAGLVQAKLGAVNAGAFDLNTACTGFLYALVIGSQFIAAGTYRRVLVVAGETLSRFMNWKDRGTCVLFGDGAGAALLEARDGEDGVIATCLGCEGDTGGTLTIAAGGSANPASNETVSMGQHFVAMRGNEIYRLAVRRMRDTLEQLSSACGIPLSEVETVIPHQANIRIIESMASSLAIPPEKLFLNIQRFGNVGSASIAIALSEHLSAGQPRPGSMTMLVSFGGGLTWAGVAIRWPSQPRNLRLI